MCFIVFLANGRLVEEIKTKEIEIECSINDKDYIINVGSDGYFNCSNCSNDIQKELKNNYIDFSNLSKTKNNIKEYFTFKDVRCE